MWSFRYIRRYGASALSFFGDFEPSDYREHRHRLISPSDFFGKQQERGRRRSPKLSDFTELPKQEYFAIKEQAKRETASAIDKDKRGQHAAKELRNRNAASSPPQETPHMNDNRQNNTFSRNYGRSRGRSRSRSARRLIHLLEYNNLFGTKTSQANSSRTDNIRVTGRTIVNAIPPPQKGQRRGQQQ